LKDPILKQRIIKLIVDISSRALDKNPSFSLKVLEHILMTRLPDLVEYPTYSEAVKELHGLASHELRRLAMRYADYFSVSRISAPLGHVFPNKKLEDILRSARAENQGNHHGQPGGRQTPHGAYLNPPNYHVWTPRILLLSL
jgi:hypothetical protein